MVERTSVQVEARPSRALRRYVTGYAGFELRGFPPGVHLGTPGRALNVVVSLAEPLDVATVDGAAAPSGRFEAIAGGLMSRSIAVRHDGSQHGVRMSLTPLGARAIFGMPSAALAHEVVTLEDVLGSLGAELVDRLRGVTSWEARFAAVDALLTRSVGRWEGRRGQGIHPEVDVAWRHLVVSRGRTRIEALAADVGWSRRYLGDRFRDEIGLTPKQVARILRFEHAYELATTGDPPSWVDVSTTTGYADQAHLVREWREFTGCSPTAWRRNEVLVGPER